MIAQARLRSPHLDFAVGSMTDLDLPDGSVGGVCAWYSTIHVPGGEAVVLLAFQVGNQPRRLTEAFGIQVDLECHRRTHPRGRDRDTGVGGAARLLDRRARTRRRRRRRVHAARVPDRQEARCSLN
jgi:hypothetical protein